MSLASKIYQFPNSEYRKILDGIDYQDNMVSIEAIDAVDDDPEEKVLNVVSIIRSLDADAETIKKEMDRLKALKQQVETNKDQLREWVLFAMLTLDKKVVEDATTKVSIRNSPPKLIVDDELGDEWFDEETVVKRVMKTKELKAALKDGDVKGAHLQQNMSLIIK